MTATATLPPGCPRCGGPGKSLEKRRPERTHAGRTHRAKQRRVCVPCGRSLGVVWTEFGEGREQEFEQGAPGV